MTLYDFLEEILCRGGRIEDVELVQGKGVGDGTFEHTSTLIKEYLGKSPDKRADYRKDRRFGFDRGSYIGELLVVGISRKPALVASITLVTVAAPTEALFL